MAASAGIKRRPEIARFFEWWRVIRNLQHTAAMSG
jgi:hypothetical protein